jgi:two-component system sensor histidine kinase KdpD
MEIAGDPSQSLVAMTRQAYELGQGHDDPPSGTWVHDLQVAGSRIGSLGFQGLSDTETLAAPLSLLAGATLERAQSFHAASAAAATSQVETLRSAIVDAFAHQFKTPLAAILAAAGGIREARKLTRPQLEMVDMIEGETLRLSRLATRLLFTARLDKDDVQPTLAPTKLTDLLFRLVDQWPSEAHRVSIESDGAAIQVASDPELLSLALTQLLDNAFKYSRSNNVLIAVESKNDMAYVRVRNYGSFVQPGERERIFERFYRGSAATSGTTGAGLGLYVARKIVHAHSGTLELERSTAQNAETTFCLTLPILETESQTCPQSHSA